MKPYTLLRYVRYIYIISLARIAKDLSLPLFHQFTELIGSTCFFLLHLISFQFIISKFSFPGWTMPQLWILISTFEIFTYLSFFLLFRGFIYTVRNIADGSFDLILSKPMSSRVVSFFRAGGNHNLFTTLAGVGLLIWSLATYHIFPNPLGLILYILFLFSGIWIIYCIGVAFISLNLRFGRLDSTTGVVFQIQETYKYPATLYSKFNFFFWIFLSAFSLLTTLPTVSILSKPLEAKYLILYLIVFLFTSLLAQWSWSSGLRHYSSASS